MLIYPCCRLCAAVAIRALEIEGGDVMLAEGACEGGAAIHRFGRVISHIFMVVLVRVRAWGNGRATLGRAGQRSQAAYRSMLYIASNSKRVVSW